MKKRIVSIILCITVVLAALIACGKDNGDVDAATSGRVYEAGWRSAFDFSGIENGTYKIISVSEAKDGKTNTRSSECKTEGNKSYYKTTNDTNTEEKYYVEDDGVNYVYSVNSATGKWTKVVLQNNDFFPIFSDFADSSSNKNWGNTYTYFQYDAAKKIYVCTSDLSGVVDIDSEYDRISVSISDGKIAMLKSEYNRPDEQGGGTVVSTILFYDLGTTEVTLPVEGSVVGQ